MQTRRCFGRASRALTSLGNNPETQGKQSILVLFFKPSKHIHQLNVDPRKNNASTHTRLNACYRNKNIIMPINMGFWKNTNNQLHTIFNQITSLDDKGSATY